MSASLADAKTPVTTPAATGKPGGLGAHFYVAAGLLLALAVSWNSAMQLLGWAMAKRPVPWPGQSVTFVLEPSAPAAVAATFAALKNDDAVEVQWKGAAGQRVIVGLRPLATGAELPWPEAGRFCGKIVEKLATSLEVQPRHLEVEDHRLTNFPVELGPPGNPRFILVGSGAGEPKKDGLPLGITVLKDDDASELGMMTSPLNWYYAAMYRDTNAPGVLVQVYVTYYTGLLDAVPHVPERCLVAGGGSVLADQSQSIDLAMTAVAPEWAGQWLKLKAYRTAYEVRAGSGMGACQYHLFSMNGLPTDRWEEVRINLAKPWLKYCYFAKVQVAVFSAQNGQPLRPEPDMAASDRACREFLDRALPVILRFLPSAGTVADLENGARR
jgi:hypothetical protein